MTEIFEKIIIRVARTGIGKTAIINTMLSPERLIDKAVISPNRHDASITWLDCKMDPADLRTQSLLNQLNDRVELFNQLRDCLNYLEECRETTLFIVSGKSAIECLGSVHSLPSIDSIIIYCASPKKYDHLLNDSYSKILACIASETELIQCVHKWIDLKCQIHFYTWIHQKDYFDTLTRQSSLFLASYLLRNCIEHLAYDKRRQEMLKICLPYYVQNPSELHHIREFELTYTPADAINWYTRNSFVHKMINRAIRSFNSSKLRAVAFYIRDLRAQLREWRFTTSLEKDITTYHGLVMRLSDIDRIQSTPVGSLFSTNGFLSTSRKREVAMAFGERKRNTLSQPLCNVLLQINLGVDNSPIIFADIAHLSAFPEEGEILFDLGAVFSLQNVIYEEEAQLHTIELTIATQNDYNFIGRLLKIAKYRLDESVDDGGQTSLIGKLLDFDTQADEKVEEYHSYWQKFLSFKSGFNCLKYLNLDKHTQLLNEKMPRLTKFNQYFHNSDNQIETFDYSNKLDLAQYDELLLARFEPVLFFHLPDKSIQQEQSSLSLIFESQYRRFITKHLTLTQAQENLEEHYYIYYISSELPVYMEEDLRIKFYELKWPSENEDPTMKMKLMERLRSELLHGLGMFYSDQAKRLATEQDNQAIVKALKRKGAQCYQLLADESEKIIQRYKSK